MTAVARVLRAGFTAAVVAFCLTPAVVVVASSFTSAQHLSFPPVGFSTRWYRDLLARPDFTAALGRSLLLAAITATVSTALGALASFALVRRNFPGRQVFETVFMAPVSVPHVVLGIGLLQLFDNLRVPSSLWTLLAGHVLITVPFAIRLVSAGLTGFDRSLERAAQSLGASRTEVLRLVTLPLVRTGLTGALILTFIISFDDVAMTVFLSSVGTETLPVKLYAFAEQSATPIIDASSSVLIALGFGGLLLLERVVGLERIFGTARGDDRA